MREAGLMATRRASANVNKSLTIKSGKISRSERRPPLCECAAHFTFALSVFEVAGLPLVPEKWPNHGHRLVASGCANELILDVSATTVLEATSRLKRATQGAVEDIN